MFNCVCVCFVCVTKSVLLTYRVNAFPEYYNYTPVNVKYHFLSGHMHIAIGDYNENNIIGSGAIILFKVLHRFASGGLSDSTNFPIA